MPRRPVSRKVACQPNSAASQIASGGVIIAPIEEPELSQPVAIERSFDGS